MSAAQRSRTSRLWLLALIGFVAMLGAGSYGYQHWQKKNAPEDMVAPGLRLINYTDDDVYGAVRNSRFPEPGQGASYGVGPNAGGGGLMCCVPIPTKWRPGINMNIHYRFGKWSKGMEKMAVVELPEYPDGEAGELFLLFYSETEFELVSSGYSPRHAKWPGRRVEPILFGEQ